MARLGYRRLKFTDLNIKPIQITPFIHCKNPAIENSQEVYRVMLSTYGQVWHDRYGPNPDDGIWSTVLAKVTMQQIKKGFERLANSIKEKDSKFKDYMPNPWEFLDMCRPAANEEKFNK